MAPIAAVSRLWTSLSVKLRLPVALVAGAVGGRPVPFDFAVPVCQLDTFDLANLENALPTGSADPASVSFGNVNPSLGAGDRSLTQPETTMLSVTLATTDSKRACPTRHLLDLPVPIDWFREPTRAHFV